MKEKESVKSFGELPTLGHEGTCKEEPRSAAVGPSWTALGLSEATTQRPPEGAGGIVDDGRTDGARRWKAGETILDRYVVEGELGQGGMGVVYGCLDKVGGVRVAVKCLPPELGHNSVEMEEVRENFQLVYGLSHPNIAGVRQLERDGKGEYYLVMELATGESLRRWLRGKWKAGGVSLADAAGVLRQVAAALDYAHRRKIIHRDVKPGNVIIDGKGEVKVLDFGLAAQIRTSLSRASHAYRGTSGTGPYMAPEQWRAQPQDAKTDQYALGVMAYEMLAGRLPFENPELAVLKDAVLNGEVAAIPGVPEGAMAAIRRAMAKRAEERFGSCGEFVEALAGEREDRPTVRPGQDSDAATAGRQGGAVAGGRRKARGRTLMGWVVALALAGAVGVWWKGSGGRAGKKWEEGKGNAVEETARPEGSPHQQEAEAARRALEEQRLAEQKAAEEAAQRAADEAAMKLEEAAAEEDDGAKWRAEKEAIDNAKTVIDILQSNARETVKVLDDYRKFPTGLSAHINAAEKAAQELAAVRMPGTGDEAKDCMAAAQTASGKLTAELGWLAQNRTARDAATEEEKEIAASLDGPLKEYEAADCAKGKWREGTKAREEGNEALAAGRFGDAEAKLKKSKDMLGEALQEAKAALARRRVASAKEYAKAEMWEKCLAMANEALAAEPGNAEAQALKKEALAGEVFPLDLGNGVTLEMVPCPGVAADFWMGKYEVTQEQWQQVMGKNPSKFGGKPKNPVEQVSWNDCQEFVKKVNALSTARASGLVFRLPTEEEWETACWAGAPKGADYCKLADGTQITKDNLSRVAYYGHVRLDGPSRVGGGREPNAWGLYDMHGNVWEWTEIADGGIRVNRGGSFLNTADYCSVGLRGSYYPEFAYGSLGLRLAASGRAATR